MKINHKINKLYEYSSSQNILDIDTKFGHEKMILVNTGHFFSKSNFSIE